MKSLLFTGLFNRQQLFRQFNIIFFRKSRTITGDKIVILDERTLTGRIKSYLKTNASMKICNSNESSLYVLNKLKNSNFTERHSPLTTEQIVGLLQFARNKSLIENKRGFQKLMQYLDSESRSQIKSLQTSEIFRILDGFLETIPNRITQYKFYYSAMRYLAGFIDTMTHNQMIKFIFYIGLQKKNKEAQGILLKCLSNIDNENLNSMTIEDLSIICNSTYKTSTPIKNKEFLKQVIKRIYDDLTLLKDCALFTNFVKTIRYNRFQDEDILRTISYTIMFNKTSQYYTFAAICHILALYADYLFYDEALLTLFSNVGLESIKKTPLISQRDYLSNTVRIKDIHRFLWALSTLGYKLNDSSLHDIIVPNLLTRVKIGEFEKHIDVLIDIVTYLWILNYQSAELIEYCLTKKNAAAVREIQTKTKARLNLLLSSMKFENPCLYKKIGIEPVGEFFFNVDLQIKNRPYLQRIFESLISISVDHKVLRFSYTCEVPHLNVVGITGFGTNDKKLVHIEVFDDFVCVKNKPNQFTGNMQMKLRILENQDEALITISKEEIEDCSKEELCEILKDELNLIC